LDYRRPPREGKTALGVQFILANGAVGTPTFAFSLEMQDLEIGERFLAAYSSIPAVHIRNPQMIKRERWNLFRMCSSTRTFSPVAFSDRTPIMLSRRMKSVFS
jgi:replicative DNA helicase